MSFNRKSAKNTARRILADSANAKHRFGFAGEHGSPITENAPKLSDLWFIEFKAVSDDVVSDVTQMSGLAKAISSIAISTSTMPVDQYGKRIYVPTRVDFPEVSLTMYDTVDGKMFDFAEDIYSKFFKNQDAKVTGANAEEVLTSAHEHGRKIPENKHSYYHQHFEKITIYHFFGNLDASTTTGVFERQNRGKGTLQKIELINPLVTNIVFSPSDYSVTDIRTTDFTVQPENIIIGNVDETVAFPSWMTLGMDYMLDELSPQLKRKEGNLYPDKFAEGPRGEYSRFKSVSRADGNENYEDSLGNQRVNQYGNDDRTQAESLTDPARIEQQEYNDTNRKLNELMRLYNAQIQNPNEQGNEALEMALKSQIGTINAARQSRFERGQEAGGNQFDTPYTPTYTNPDIPTFGGIGNSNPGGQGYPRYSTDIGSAMIRELVGSFFGNRKFDTNNIKGAVINKMIGNDGKSEGRKILGQVLTDGMVSSNNGAYQTTTKANQSIPTKNTEVFKTNNTDMSIGVSKAILRKFLNN
jgi:hypothetical protein